MINRLNDLASSWADFFLLMSVQNFVFLAVILCLLYILRRKDARLLQGIALIGLIKLLIPPFYAVSFDKYPVPGNTAAFVLNSIIIPETSETIAPISDAVISNSAVPDAAISEPGPALTLQSVLMLGWVVIFAGIIVFNLRRMCRLRKLFSRAAPVDVTRYTEVHGKNVTFLKSDLVHSPLVLGFFRHRIVLPDCWDTWSDDCKRSVLAHELAHIRHGDHWINLMQFFVQAVHFFNPMVWLLNRKMNQFREMTCDDAAVKTNKLTSTRYSNHLVKIAETITHAGCSNISTAFTESPHQLEKRVSYQLTKKKEGTMSKAKYSTAMVFLLALVIPFSWYFSDSGTVQNGKDVALNVPTINPYGAKDGQVQVIAKKPQEIVRLVRLQEPISEIPKIVIKIEAGEIPKEEMEENYTKKVESLLMNLNNVKRISSLTKKGESTITVEFVQDADMDAALLNVQKAVAGLTNVKEIKNISFEQYTPVQEEQAVYVNIYTGNDETGDGTKDRPFKTIEKALQAAKLMNTNIIVKPGTAEGLFIIEKPSEKTIFWDVQALPMQPSFTFTRPLWEYQIKTAPPQVVFSKPPPPQLKVEEETQEQLSDEVKSLLRSVNFTIQEELSVTFIIYDVLGDQIRKISPKVYTQGEFTFTWSGKDDDGNVMDSGTYIVVMKAGDKKEVKRITHIK